MPAELPLNLIRAHQKEVRSLMAQIEIEQAKAMRAEDRCAAAREQNRQIKGKLDYLRKRNAELEERITALSAIAGEVAKTEAEFEDLKQRFRGHKFSRAGKVQLRATE